MTDVDSYLTLSGLMHFVFCRRRWALIYIERQWAENALTAEGRILHERAHDIGHERRGGLITARAVPVYSHTMRVSGECDVVEWRKDPNGVEIPQYGGRYSATPVEYKKGKPLCVGSDEAQLCGQAMCLEEMLLCEIPRGFLYYGEPHRRIAVEFTPELRDTVRRATDEMWQLYERGHTPTVKPTKMCTSCSLNNLCMPKLSKAESVTAYIARHIGDDA